MGNNNKNRSSRNKQEQDKEYIIVEPESTRNEEYAAEFTADDYQRSETQVDSDQNTSTLWGWIGIVLSVISFFMWPVLLGAAGIILGFISRGRGADTLGNIAIIAGAASIVISLFILPFF